MSIFDDLPLFNLPQYVNEDITSGVSETNIYIANIYDIEKDAEPKRLGDADVKLEDTISITDDIIFKEGKGFRKITIQTETGEVKDVMEGNKGNKKYKNVFEYFLTNNNEGNLAYSNIFRNAPVIVLVMEKSKRIRKVGSMISPAYIEDGSTTSGKGSVDDNGVQVTVSAATGQVAPIYKGNITLIDG